jgi:hypothetical protein
MGGGGDPCAYADLVSRARSLVVLLLVCLDEASDSIAELETAFKSEDPHRALVTNERLQRVWSHAYVTIQILGAALWSNGEQRSSGTDRILSKRTPVACARLESHFTYPRCTSE